MDRRSQGRRAAIITGDHTGTEREMADLDHFDRRFFGSENEITRIGSGSLGGKAQGLFLMAERIHSRCGEGRSSGISVSIPRSTVIATDFFDEFMESNDLYEVVGSDLRDDRIAHAFQQADLPPRLVGDLRSLADQVHVPLAIRSSSLLEDAMYRPFAGVYATKMIPNNQPKPDTRFQRLVEAVKFVYASTFFQDAKRYINSVNRESTDEKMAVIIQEVVGERIGDRFYPTLSGVARSYDFYAFGGSSPEDGVVNLALGLGKTIVDGGMTWSYSPAAPQAPPPYNDVGDLLKNTQTEFWAVNMGKPPAYDPIRETEYLVKAGFSEAEYDNTLRFTASTYDAQSDRLCPGIGARGPRVINFASILVYGDIALNEVVKEVLAQSEEELGAEVEIEFAMTLDRKKGVPARLGFLQVRPMVVSDEQVDIPLDLLEGGNVVVATTKALGNGATDSLHDIVYVRPDTFDPRSTQEMALELEKINSNLVAQGRSYVLMGFGRWGSSDPWLGIPVAWSQISGARVIVEATLPKMAPDLSQGSHFFHNLTSFRVCYFSVHHAHKYAIDWDWIERNQEIAKERFVRHVRTDSPLSVQVDGRSGRGVILRYDRE